ncbi:MAG TPA: bifunctional hydroxymethylpyrimidine kinase/phosphomethylpyrimidine kinase [Dehalococcoidia bacterium]|nr:bifunctional hydroxymethylpyrimidine kinase/phosphomethylpyrimidine kinase [Dehalococcoidia bacterium]
MRSVLTIAGSDSSGGAGIQADLKTFAAHGVYGMSVITALTAQNTQTVTGVFEAPAEFVGQQIDTVVVDIRPDAVKTGMLSSAPIIAVVAEKIGQHGLRNVVVDPVMVSKSGARLLREDAVEALRSRLLPLADVVTPNIPEAEDLLGRVLRTEDDARQAAEDVLALGPRAVVLKGGHREGDVVTDLLFDGEQFHTYSGPRVQTSSTHGTGCTFASAIAAQLALGSALPQAVRLARGYVQGALEHARPLGHGHGPVNHFWRWEER